MKKRLFEILDVPKPGDKVSQFADFFLVTLIIANIIALVLQSMESVRHTAAVFFWWFEVVSVAIFTIEYVLRVWTITEREEFRDPVHGRLKYMATPLAIFDLLAVLPFYLPFLNLDLRVLRAVRLFRLIRILKLGRYSSALKMFGRVIMSRKEELLTIFSVLAVVLLMSSSLMYFCEHDTQPEVFSSIPAAMWWAIVTMTTVGYGDIYPVTIAGKILGGLIAITGIGMFALPTGILGAAFIEEARSRNKKVCPHCGKEIEF